MEDTEFENRVSELEKRVASLERQVDRHEKRTHFEQCIRDAFPQYSDIEHRKGWYGSIAWVTGIGRGDADEALEQLDDLNCGSSINETSEGIEVEVWSKQNSES